MATDASTADDVRRRLHQIRGGPSIGDQVVSEGLRQLSLPGQYTRGLLAGKPGEKATSAELLGRLGVTNPSPVGQLAWDVATDPLTYAGPGLMKAGGAASDLLRAGGAALGEGAAANPLANALRKFGGSESGALGLKFDPYQHAAEAGMERWDPEWVNQRTFYHGTGTSGLTAGSLDPLKTNPEGLFGRGIYTTDEAARSVPHITQGYAEARAQPLIEQAFLDAAARAKTARNPWDVAQRLHQEIRGAREGLRPGRDSFAPLNEWLRDYREVNQGRFQPGSTQAVRDLNRYGPGFIRSMYPQSDRAALDALQRLNLITQHPGAGTIYQGQSNFQNILDVERQLPLAEFQRLQEGLVPVGEAADQVLRAGSSGRRPAFGANIQGAGETSDVLRMAQQANVRLPAEGPDLLVRALRDLGYDALTHTGGGRTAAGQASGPHQVVIGLDPNNVLGRGQATPYQQWEPYASLR